MKTVDYALLSDGELEAQIAVRLLGWTTHQWERDNLLWRCTGCGLRIAWDPRNGSDWNRDARGDGYCWHGLNRQESQVPRFATSLDAAWASVAQALMDRGWLVWIKGIPAGFPWRANDETGTPISTDRYACELTWVARKTADDVRRSIHRRPTAFADNPARALCLAALEALDSEHAAGA